MIDIDILTEAGAWPDEEQMRPMIEKAVAVAARHAGFDRQDAEVSVLLTDDTHIAALNHQWRNKQEPTNVLSFPATAGAMMPALGDIVLARQTITREADIDGKSLDAHLMHLIVHGFLHLLGYDHIEVDQAEQMETLERAILTELGINDPYAPFSDQ